MYGPFFRHATGPRAIGLPPRQTNRNEKSPKWRRKKLNGKSTKSKQNLKIKIIINRRNFLYDGNGYI